MPFRQFFLVFAFAAAIFIPEKIKREQTYSSLLSDCREYDFAAAVQGIIDFFYDSCGQKIERISEEHKRIYQESKCAV